MKTFFLNHKKILFFLLFFLIFSLKSFSQNTSVVKTINLSWEALDSYTYPGYDGFPLPGDSSLIKLVADPEIITIAGELDPKKFFYSWTYNDYYLYNYSKTGGNTVLLYLDDLESVNTINLKVYTNNKEEMLLGEKTINIKARDTYPIVYLKNDNPILMFGNAINKKYEAYRVDDGDLLDLVAYPFYFSVKDPDDQKLDYIWSLNDIPGTGNNKEFIHSITNAKSTNINIKISNQKEYSQEGESVLQFNY